MLRFRPPDVEFCKVFLYAYCLSHIGYGLSLTSTPAAADTIATFLNETGTKAEDYDLILTGDLGKIGTELLYELLQQEYDINIRSCHNDTGLMMYDIDKQDVHSGGSGCGCCGTIMCSKILNELNEGKMSRVLVVATGALLSTVSAFQGESIPGIAHGVLLTDGRENHVKKHS